MISFSYFFLLLSSNVTIIVFFLNVFLYFYFFCGEYFLLIFNIFYLSHYIPKLRLEVLEPNIEIIYLWPEIYNIFHVLRLYVPDHFPRDLLLLVLLFFVFLLCIVTKYNWFGWCFSYGFCCLKLFETKNEVKWV